MGNEWDNYLMTRQEVMELLRVSDSGERRGRQNADWPAHIMVGRKILYRRSSVLAWLSGREGN